MAHELDPTGAPLLESLTDRSNVVVGVDGSEAGQRALHYAVGVARRTGARLIVVHVRRTFVTYNGMGPEGLVDDGGLDEETRAEVEDVVRCCEVSSVYVDVPTTGSIAPALARVAEKVRADAVVVGASHSPLHRVAGAVGTQLVRTSPCPVTVVP